MSARPSATADALGRVPGPADRHAVEPAVGRADGHRLTGPQAREETARRPLLGSLVHSDEPSVDIDREARLVEGRYGTPAHRASPYELWDQLSEEQRVTLSIHKVCRIARIGRWFEISLLPMRSADRDPPGQHTQYALTEIADECRRSANFAPRANRARRVVGGWLISEAHPVATNLIHPEVYRGVGLDPRAARKVARHNSHHQESIGWTARKLVPFRHEVRMIGGPSEWPWRRASRV
jgi:hypothetical protein